MADSSSVGTFLGAAGGCPEIVFNGKAWKIGHPTQRAKATLENLAVMKATQEITALKGVVDPATYAEMFAGHRADIVAKHYHTWGEGWKRVIFSPLNTHLFVLSLLRENHPEATEEDARALVMSSRESVEVALLQVVPDFFTLLLEEALVPPDRKQELRGIMAATFQQIMPPRPSQPTHAT